MTLPSEIPLFPLKVVLFPGMLLPLHIFEPRYRRMLQVCQEKQEPFGLVLANTEAEALSLIAGEEKWNVDELKRLQPRILPLQEAAVIGSFVQY